MRNEVVVFKVKYLDINGWFYLGFFVGIVIINFFIILISFICCLVFLIEFKVDEFFFSYFFVEMELKLIFLFSKVRYCNKDMYTFELW